MNVALYARVSSEKQAEKDLSIPAQLKQMRHYCAKKGWCIVTEFIDEAESARTANRREFQRMIAAAKSKQKLFEIILVWKLSRFARSREDSAIYKALLRKNGVRVVSMNEAFDDSPAGGLLEGIIEVIDEFYSSNLAQDTLRGMKESASQGYFTGGTTPLGYRSKEVRHGSGTRRVLDIDPDWAPVVQQMFQHAKDGLGAKEIATRLNESGVRTRRNQPWTKNTVLYTLRNEVYTGVYVWNKKKSRPKERNAAEIIRVANAVPALVPRDVFESIQAQLNERNPSRMHPRAVSSPYLLAGLLRCAPCDRVMQGGTAKSGRYRYYACYNRLTKAKSLCASHFLPQHVIEAAVLARIRDYILTEENLTRLVRLVNEAVQQTRTSREARHAIIASQLGDKRRRLEVLFESLETGHLEFADVAPRIKQLREQIDLLEPQAESAVRAPEQELCISESVIREHVVRLGEVLETGSVSQRKAFLRSFIRKIDYEHPVVKIFYTFPIIPGNPGRNYGGGTEEPRYDELTVLGMEGKGSSGRARTYNPPVNSDAGRFQGNASVF